MINSQMDNPFMIGDLVHIPTGVVFYVQTNVYTEPIPSLVNNKASVGLIIKKDTTGLYRISVGLSEYLIKKEDVSLITRKDVR